MYHRTSVSLLLLGFLAVQVSSLVTNCLQCNSITDPGCAEADMKYNKPCNATERGSCRLLRQDIEGNVRYARQCSAITDESEMRCVERIGTYKIRVVYCQCRKDGCNSGSRLSIFTGLLAVPTIVAFLVSFVRL